MSAPPVAVLHAPGTNRDGEAVRALVAAGAEARVVLLGEPLASYAAVCVPGGFSFGDSLGAGARFAFEVGDVLRAVAARGAPILGICNGFQVLVRTGLLGGAPGDADADADSDAGADTHHPLSRTVTLTHNQSGRFECRWVNLVVDPDSRAELVGAGVSRFSCPVAHGEGRLAVRDIAVAGALAAGGRVLVRYGDATGAPAGGAYPANPNGSVDDIAGLCDATGHIWGLMPHPEDNIAAVHHHDRPGAPGAGGGLAFFEAFVDRAR
ncbi:MAG: phosphoribosylformylglycinamidine synthase I [Acidimicrobiales bacterium]